MAADFEVKGMSRTTLVEGEMNPEAAAATSLDGRGRQA